MTFQQALTELQAKHPKAEMSPSVRRGDAARRGIRLSFTKGKGGVYVGKDADGTEVLVYFNDTAGVIACTEIESDTGPDD